MILEDSLSHRFLQAIGDCKIRLLKKDRISLGRVGGVALSTPAIIQANSFNIKITNNFQFNFLEHEIPRKL